MRLWHQSLIPKLPRQQLLGQHRECCALRGKGWGRKHSVVDYVFKYDPALLIAYHYCIMEEMENRGYHPDRTWDNPDWRGSTLGEVIDFANKELVECLWMDVNQMNKIIYPEHDEAYLQECIDNLNAKGIMIQDSVRNNLTIAMGRPSNLSRCRKCVYETTCSHSKDYMGTCPDYKRDAPDGGFYG